MLNRDILLHRVARRNEVYKKKEKKSHWKRHLQDSRLVPDSIKSVNEIALDNRFNAEWLVSFALIGPAVSLGSRPSKLGLVRLFCSREVELASVLWVRGSKSFLNGASSMVRVRSKDNSSNSDGNNLIHLSNGFRDWERMTI